MRKIDFLGKLVLCLEEAEKVGIIEDVIFNQAGELTAVVVKRGLLTSYRLVRMEQVVAIGPDAITIPSKEHLLALASQEDIKGLPTLRSVAHCRVMTIGGQFVGTVEDVVIDPLRRVITGYELMASNALGRLIEGVTGNKATIPYIGRLRYGKEMVVVPDAVINERPMGNLEADTEERWTGLRPEPTPLPVLVAPEPALAVGAARPAGPDHPTQPIPLAQLQ